MRTPYTCILLTLVACSADDEPDLSSVESALVAASIQSASPAPPVFERVQSRQVGDPTAQLNFEIRLQNTGTQTAIIDQATLGYTGAAALAPVVKRADLRKFYLDDCSRAGFGIDRSGALALDLPNYTSEEISDVDTPSTNSYATVHGARSMVFPTWGAVAVSRFAAIKLDGGHELKWNVEIPFLGFEDRANALTKADGDKSYIAVGGTHPIQNDIGAGNPYGKPWSFAAVHLDSYGAVVTRPDLTLWKQVVGFTGCSAEAVDVARVTQASTTLGYVLAGNAMCGTDSKVALVMLDTNGNLAGGFGVAGKALLDPGALPTKVSAVVADPANNDIYVVGTYGDDLMVLNTNLGGVGDAGFGPGGFRFYNPPAHDRVVGTDVKIMADRRVAIAASGRVIATNTYQLAMARVQPNGLPDPVLPGGFVWASVPGMTHAYGRAIDVHENDTWFTVSGFADNGTKRRMVAAAFAANGSPQNQFDGDGFLVMGPLSPASGYRTSLKGDFITLGGGTGSILGGARFHRKDGTPDDPSVLGVGEACAVLWPDTGILPPGATHAVNPWDVTALPTNASMQLRLLPYAVGTAITLVWSTPLELFDDGGWTFPADPPTETQTYWHVNQAHSINDDHRHAYGFSTVANAYINKERYAYDLSPLRWSAGGWTGNTLGNDGDQNNESLSYGRDVHPIGPGEIVRCASGVTENKAPGAHDVELACNGTGVPCFYDGGGNQFWIRHPDGTVSFYAHLQNTIDPDLCPFNGSLGVLPVPVEVTKHTVLGQIGNSGHSEGPHLHVEIFVPWDASDPAKNPADYADGRPLMFDNVRGIPDTVPFDEWPELDLPYPVAAQWGGTMLRMTGPNDPYPDGPTGCEPVNLLAGTGDEALEADGDAGPDLYCPDDGGVRVCIDNGDGSSDCQTCGLEGEIFAGCPCSIDDQCGPDMICWGQDVANANGVDNPGRCYPWDELPAWACAYDCKANLGDYAWCYNDFASLTGRARCMDALTETIELEMCWEYGYVVSSGCPADTEQSCVEECVCAAGGSWPLHQDDCEQQCQPSAQPAYAGECILECEDDADCQSLWGYPSEYQCDNDVGDPICRIPW